MKVLRAASQPLWCGSVALLADQGLELPGREEATGKGSLVISGHLRPSLAPTCSVSHLDSAESKDAVHSGGTSLES